MTVFLITTAFLIGYGINLVVQTEIVLNSTDKIGRRAALAGIFITLLAAVGVIYLAGH